LNYGQTRRIQADTFLEPSVNESIAKKNMRPIKTKGIVMLISKINPVVKGIWLST
jgi:hypothetical protein